MIFKHIFAFVANFDLDICCEISRLPNMAVCHIGKQELNSDRHFGATLNITALLLSSTRLIIDFANNHDPGNKCCATLKGGSGIAYFTVSSTTYGQFKDSKIWLI